jgi:hypothetical protein
VLRGGRFGRRRSRDCFLATAVLEKEYDVGGGFCMDDERGGRMVTRCCTIVGVRGCECGYAERVGVWRVEA